MSKSDKPAWEVMLSVVCPKMGRPRRTSLHTIAYVTGHKDPLALAKEMQESNKVVGYICPDVHTPVFYLKSMTDRPGMIDTRNESVWGKWGYPYDGANSLEEFVKINEYPKIKGFMRFAPRHGKKYSMERPYEPEDFPLAREVMHALRNAGYEPGITEDDLK